MVIPIRFSYTYKNYPFSPKATMKSKQLGIFTCGAMCFVYGLFWAMIVDGILMGIGIPSGVSIILSLVSLVGLVALIRRIKHNGALKVEQMAMADLLSLRHTDPAAFAQYAAVFKEELNRYQTPYQYQAPPQYQASAQYHAPQTPPVSDLGQNASKQGFDIQTEQPDPISEEPIVAEKSVQPEAPAQQTNVIELPEVMEVPAQAEPAAEQPGPNEAPTIPEKKFCGQCGTKLKPGSHFCHNCGSKL